VRGAPLERDPPFLLELRPNRVLIAACGGVPEPRTNVITAISRNLFRIDHDLAATLRELPNQTKFVEDTLREALGRTCPVCAGSGRLPLLSLSVTNVREGGIKP
jgi:hypothetical protein